MSRKLASVSLFLLVSALSAGIASAATSIGHTTLTIHGTPTGVLAPGTDVTIYGKLNSGDAACRSGQTIQLFELGTSGPIDSTVTDAGGNYSFAPRTVSADTAFQTNFAGSVSGVHPDTHDCAGSTSPILKVKVAGSSSASVLGLVQPNLQGRKGGDTPSTGGAFLGLFLLLGILVISGVAAIVLYRRRAPAGHNS